MNPVAVIAADPLPLEWQRAARRLVAAGAAAIALALAGLLGWAWLAPLSGALVAAGVV